MGLSQDRAAPKFQKVSNCHNYLIDQHFLPEHSSSKWVQFFRDHDLHQVYHRIRATSELRIAPTLSSNLPVGLQGVLSSQDYQARHKNTPTWRAAAGAVAEVNRSTGVDRHPGQMWKLQMFLPCGLEIHMSRLQTETKRLIKKLGISQIAQLIALHMPSSKAGLALYAQVFHIMLPIFANVVSQDLFPKILELTGHQESL